MSHTETWRNWIFQTHECTQAHPQPGSCVGTDGLIILSTVFVLAGCLIAILFWRNKEQKKLQRGLK